MPQLVFQIKVVLKIVYCSVESTFDVVVAVTLFFAFDLRRRVG